MDEQVRAVRMYDAFLTRGSLTLDDYFDMGASLTKEEFETYLARLKTDVCFITSVPAFPWVKWCLVHDVEDDAGHAFDNKRVSTLD